MAYVADDYVATGYVFDTESLPRQLPKEFIHSGSVKPNYSVTVDYSNPITNGILTFHLMTDDNADVVSNNKLIRDVSTYSYFEPANNQQSLRNIDTTSASEVTLQNRVIPDSHAHTILCCVSMDTVTSTSSFGFYRQNISTAHHIIRMLSSTSAEFLINGLTNDRVSHTFSPTSGKPFVIGGSWGGNNTKLKCITWDESSGSIITENGSNSTGTYDASSPELMASGGVNSDVNYYWFATWDRELSDAEVRAFIENPYQILKPANDLYYYTAGTSGGGSQTLNSDYLSSNSTIYQPTTTVGQTLNSDYLSSNATVYEPSLLVNPVINADYLASASSVYTPTITTEATLTADYLSTNSAVYDPLLTQGLTTTPDYLASNSAVNQPTITTAVTLTADKVDSNSAVHQPLVELSLQTIEVDYVVATSEVFIPTIIGGEQGAGGKPSRKVKRKKYLTLPDGKVVEVSSQREAQKLLDAYYKSLGQKPKKLKQKRVKLKPTAKAEVTETATQFYTPERSVKPVQVAPEIVLQPVDVQIIIRQRLRMKQRKDEEEILLLLA